MGEGGLGQPLRPGGLAFEGRGQAISHGCRDKSPDQLVFQAHEGLSTARITLARATTKELTVDAPRFVALRCYYVQAAVFGDPMPESKSDVRFVAGL